jgi:hypothetical protein
MMSTRRDEACQAIGQYMKAVFGLFLGLSLASPAGAAAGDTLGGADSLPPPGTYFSAYVTDSATGLPLAGADLNIRNPQALFTVTHTDSGGWAHVARSGLPSYGMSAIQTQWVTASYPGYVAQMGIRGIGDTANRVLRFALSRATAENSITFTGTVIDSATLTPIARLSIDISHGEKGGWMTYVTTTDDTGGFIITGIPVGHYDGYFWVRRPNREYFLPVSLTQSGMQIIVSGLSTTSLAAPRNRQRAAAQGKSDPVLLFLSRHLDAAGRWRD